MRGAWLGVFGGLCASTPALARDVVVGVVMDGPWEGHAAMAEAFVAEIGRVTGETVVLDDDGIRLGDFSPAGVDAALDAAVSDRDNDVVIALGVLGSGRAAARSGFSRPVIAPLLLPGVPSAAPTAPVRNLDWIRVPVDLAGGVDALAELVPVSRVAFVANPGLVDGVVGSELPGLPAGVSLVVVPAEDADRVDAALDGVDGVVVGPLTAVADGVPALVERLEARHLPSYSLVGREHVEAGFLAGSGSGDVMQRLGRAVGLHVNLILRGTAPESLPTEVGHRSSLALNLATARAIGLSPSWSVLAEADLVDGGPVDALTLSLEQSMTRATEANADLLAQIQFVEADRTRIAQARSALLPDIGVGLGVTALDADRARASFGLLPEFSGRFQARVSQVIYDADAYGGPAIESALQRGRDAGVEALTLDVQLAAAQRYVDLVTATTALAVRRADLQRTRDYLELARSRLSAGAAGPEEVARTESLRADARQGVVEAYTAREVAGLQLAQLLQASQARAVRADVADVDGLDRIDPAGELVSRLSSPASFAALGRQLTALAEERAPELAQIEATLEAQEQALATGKARYAPSLGLSFQLDQWLFRAGEGSPGSGPTLPGVDLPDTTNWTAGAVLNLPLLEGARRPAQVKEAKTRVGAIEQQRIEARSLVEQRVRSAMQQALNSTLGVENAEESARAAGRNLEIVTTAYQAGGRRLVELVDARDAALQAELGLVRARARQLGDLLALQRAVGWFAFLEPDGGAALVRALDDTTPTASEETP